MFLVEAEQLAGLGPGDLLEVAGAEGRHAVAVARVTRGEQVLVGDGAGRRALVEVVATERAVLRTRVVTVEHESDPPLRLVLVQALAKGDRDEQAVQAATELGVDAVLPWQAQRSVVQWRGERADRGVRRWQAVVAAATKQSRRYRTPEVRPLVHTEQLERLVERAALTLVLHEAADRPLAGVDLPDAGEVLLVVGPEGGLTDAELTALQAAGGRPVRLGREVLRTSTAGPAALAVLNARGRWR